MTAAAQKIQTEQTTLVEQEDLNRLAKDATSLGYDVVDVAGFLDQVDEESSRQRQLMSSAQKGAEQVMAANEAVISSVDTVSKSANSTLNAVEETVQRVRNSGERTKEVASWVQSLDDRMIEVEKSLKGILANNAEITDIASQVNILAVNAKIEAARAGEAGLGFAVVAEAINDLSFKTTAAADQIQDNIKKLSTGIKELRSEAGGVSEEATTVLEEASATDASLTDVTERVRETSQATNDIAARAKEVNTASGEFGPVFKKISTGFTQTVEAISESRKRVTGLIDTSERIVQESVSIGADTDDGKFIDCVIDIAARISKTFEKGVEEGRITQNALFNQRYQIIRGTDPEQLLAPYTRFTDEVLPPIQEAALELDKNVVFCACVDRNGYLPTHNKKFSAKQGPDPVWNAANCRNRRLFNDRVGLKAGQSKTPFLLQVYRRDMGGGEFVMMKDLSAPIMVNNKHWGGVRLAYKF